MNKEKNVFIAANQQKLLATSSRSTLEPEAVSSRYHGLCVGEVEDELGDAFVGESLQNSSKSSCCRLPIPRLHTHTADTKTVPF